MQTGAPSAGAQQSGGMACTCNRKARAVRAPYRQNIFRKDTIMAELNWEANSKVMFDKMIESSPKPFRAMTEKKLMEAVVAKAGDGGAVTEAIIIECVQAVTPKPFVGMAMKTLEPLKTK